MQNKYTKLLRHSAQRAASGKARLAQSMASLDVEQAKLVTLSNAISLQQQLMQVGAIESTALHRQQLFDWLLKVAVIQRRTQLLKVDLHQQRELIDNCKARVAEYQESCKKLEKRRERYRILQDKELARLRLRQINAEEFEIEEYMSWSK